MDPVLRGKRGASSSVVVTGLRAAFLLRLLEGQTMQSILQILLINVKEGVGKKTNTPFRISEAHCVLKNDDGTPGAVGVLNVPKALEDIAKPGQTYSASFALEAPTYGENAGKIIASLKGLTPIPDNYFGAKGSPSSTPAPKVGAQA